MENKKEFNYGNMTENKFDYIGELIIKCVEENIEKYLIKESNELEKTEGIRLSIESTKKRIIKRVIRYIAVDNYSMQLFANDVDI